jgi:hypothetical protein
VSWAQSRSAVAFGAVCNEVARVELHSGNGAVRQVPLVEGLFAVRARPGDQLYAVTASGGHVPVGAPAPAAPVPTAVFAGPRPVAQLNLLPPSGAGGAKSPAGKAQVVMIGSGRRGIVISARSMPANTRGDAYAVWLFSDKLHLVMLGFVNPGVGRNGRLSTAGGLPGDAASYRYILITLETSHSPRVPGRVVLEGSFAVR